MHIVNIPELLVAILSINADGVKGRTAIQKLGYFCSVKLGEEAGYGPDYYGPYSSLVAMNIRDLVGADFINETKQRTRNGRLMYSYCLTEDGKELIEDIKKNNHTFYSTVESVVKTCLDVVNNNINILSWAAKTHFILCQTKDPITYSEAIQIGRKFGWRLTSTKIESAVSLLVGLELISNS